MNEDKILTIEESDISIEDLLKMSDSKPEEGEIVIGTVVEVNNTSVAIDVGLKSEGLISILEFRDNKVKVGDKLSVLIELIEGPEGHPIVSYRKAQRIKNWTRFAEVYKNSEVIEGKVIKKVKGGFIVDIGETAFLPISQTSLRRDERNGTLVDQVVKVKIIEIDRRKHNIVVSQRRYTDEQNQKKREEVFSKISENSVVKGVVSGITSFGAFIDLGGVEGLLHISDIAWGRIEKVEDVLKIGQELEVKVTRIDQSNDKISLSLKNLTPHPWENIATKYPVGKAINGKVTSLLPFGAFVELEPGVEGLLHISEISWTEKIKHPQDILKLGEPVEVKVIDIIPEKEKISLSLKRIGINPWEEIKEKYPSGTKVKGVVTNLVPFGAFVKLTEGIEGLIHISDFSWTKKIRHPQEVLDIDEEVTAVVLEVNTEQEKIVLGLKQLAENPYTKYEVGKTVEGKVKKITDFAVFVELETDIEGIIKLSDLAIQKVKDAKEVINEGQWIKAKVLRADMEEHKIMLSIRKYEKERESEEIQKYLNREEEKVTLGDIVKNLPETLIKERAQSENNDE